MVFDVNCPKLYYSKMVSKLSHPAKKPIMELFDLHWEDNIIVSNVLPYLSLNECFNFRCASKTCLQIIDMFIARFKSLNLVNRKFSPQTFQVFTTNCTNLTELNLARCMSITDNELIPLLLQNKDIVCLDLTECSNLSAKCLQPVILHCKNLQTLNLRRCKWLTTGAVEALALHQSNLQFVDFSYCPTISESCILIFIKKFHGLKRFNLEGNPQVSDKLLFTLARYSKSLELLNLSGCPDVTDTGIRSIGNQCKSLKGLLVRGCLRVSDFSLQNLRPRVQLDRSVDDVLNSAAECAKQLYIYTLFLTQLGKKGSKQEVGKIIKSIGGKELNKN